MSAVTSRYILLLSQIALLMISTWPLRSTFMPMGHFGLLDGNLSSNQDLALYGTVALPWDYAMTDGLSHTVSHDFNTDLDDPHHVSGSGLIPSADDSTHDPLPPPEPPPRQQNSSAKAYRTVAISCKKINWDYMAMDGLNCTVPHDFNTDLDDPHHVPCLILGDDSAPVPLPPPEPPPRLQNSSADKSVSWDTTVCDPNQARRFSVQLNCKTCIELDGETLSIPFWDPQAPSANMRQITLCCTDSANMLRRRTTTLCCTDLFDGETLSILYPHSGDNHAGSVSFKCLTVCCHSDYGVIKHPGTPMVVYLDIPGLMQKMISIDVSCIKRCQISMAVEECEYIGTNSITISGGHDAFHNDTRAFGKTILLEEACCVVHLKQKNGETVFYHSGIAEADNLGDPYQVVYQLHPPICGIHPAPSLGRSIIASTIVIASSSWWFLTLRFQSPFDPVMIQTNYLLVGSMLPARIWLLPCTPGGLPTFPLTAVTSVAIMPCLVVITCMSLRSCTHQVALCSNDAPPVGSRYPKESTNSKAASHWTRVTLPQLYAVVPVDCHNTTANIVWRKGPFVAITFKGDGSCQLIAVFCKEQNNALWFHGSGCTKSSGMITFVLVSGETISDNTLSLLWEFHFVFGTVQPLQFTHGETAITPGQNQKAMNNMVPSKASWNKLEKCFMIVDFCGYTNCAIDSVVQRDRGVLTFEKEWILWYLLQYTSMVSAHYVQQTHIYLVHVWKMNTCESEHFMHLFRPTVTVGEIPTRKQGEVSSTTRYMAYLIVSACAPLTHAICLSNSENSNVQHGFSCERENYESLEEDYWDRCNSTETTRCHMIFTRLMDIDININVSKYQSCGHSIHGETKDLVDNISSAQKPERTDS